MKYGNILLSYLPARIMDALLKDSINNMKWPLIVPRFWRQFIKRHYELQNILWSLAKVNNKVSKYFSVYYFLHVHIAVTFPMFVARKMRRLVNCDITDTNGKVIGKPA